MIYSSPYPYSRSHLQLTFAETTGAGVVQHELLEQSLQHGVCSSAELFLEWTPSEHQQESLAAIRQLADKYGPNRVSVATLDALPSAERIAVAKNCGMAIALMTSRASLSTVNYPVSLITHSLVAVDTLHAYTNLLLMSRPGDAIIATSKAARDWVGTVLGRVAERLYRHGVSRNRLAIPAVPVIPIGTHPVEPLDKRCCRQALSLADDELITLWIGRFSEHAKADLEPLLTIWPQVLRSYPHSKLILAGHSQEPAYLAGLQQLACDLGITSSVRIIPNVPASLKRMLFSVADMFVSPVDNIQETFGITLIEGMMHGVPVIASDWSGYRDIIQHNVTGILVPTYIYWKDLSKVSATAGHLDTQNIEGQFATHTVVDTSALLEAIIRLSSDPDRRRDFGAAGRARALQEYSWPNVIQLFGKTWQQQSDLASHESTVDRELSALDLTVLFSHYASTELGRTWTLGVTPAGYELLSRGTTLPDEIANALCCVDSRGGVCLSDCESTSCLSEDLLLWLLKKGFLKVAGH